MVQAITPNIAQRFIGDSWQTKTTTTKYKSQKKYAKVRGTVTENTNAISAICATTMLNLATESTTHCDGTRKAASERLTMLGYNVASFSSSKLISS